MWQDPWTLIIALNKQGEAGGQLYLDDGIGYGYTRGEVVWREFKLEEGKKGKTSVLRSQRHSAAGEGKDGEVVQYKEKNEWEVKISHVEVEQVVILGMEKRPARVSVGGQEVEWTWDNGAAASGKKGGTASRLILKKPGLKVVNDWEVIID